MKATMKVSTLYKYCLLVIFCSLSAFSQALEYDYRRPLKNVNDQWHKISLPNEIYSKTNNQLSDLRILGFNAEGDTIEAAYVWNQNRQKRQTKKINFELLNESQKNGKFYYTFKIQSQNTIDEISLKFGDKNFDWDIKLEGSQDQKDWFNIVEGYRILGIKNEYTDYNFSNINFPKSSYQYYRLEIPSKKKPRLISSNISITERQEGLLQKHKIQKTKISQDKNLKRTEIEIELEEAAYISHLEMEILDQFDYNRAISIQYLTDSVKTEQGWKMFYSKISNGTLNSKKENKYYFPDKLCKKLKIIIFNQDNEILEIGTIKVHAYVYEIIARFTKKADYYLYYGNTKARYPQYDIKDFDIPKNASKISLGDEESIAIKQEKTSPLFTNRLWLWVLMLLIIFVLGFFTLKMMKDKA